VLVCYGKERVIFLQDAAVLWDDWQDLVMYQDPVFKHPLWPKFRQEVLEVCERVNEGATETDTYNLPAEVRSAPLLSKSTLLLLLNVTLAVDSFQPGSGKYFFSFTEDAAFEPLAQESVSDDRLFHSAFAFRNSSRS
jgi:hypothetical protein